MRSKLVSSILDETMTADVVPALVMPIGKLKNLKNKRSNVGEDDEDDDEDDNDMPKKATTESLIAAILEDCPCDIIPDDAEPVDAVELKSANGEQNHEVETGLNDDKAPADKDEAMDTILGKNPVAVAEGALHKMARLCQPVILESSGAKIKFPKKNAVNETLAADKSDGSNASAGMAAASVMASMGVSVPTAPMPSGDDSKLQESMQSMASLTESVTSTSQPGTPMPDHKTGNGTEVSRSFHKFSGG